MTVLAMKSGARARVAERVRRMCVVVAGGGTGGHLYPGIAIAEALLDADPTVHVHFIGAEGGLEARVLPREGFEHTLLPATRLRGGGLVVMLRGLARLPMSIARAMSVLRRLRPGAVVGVGGYASGAAVLAATLLRIPVVVQEQNAIPGMTNKLAGRLARRVYVSFEAARAFFPAGRSDLVGNPIRRGIRASLAEVSPSGRESATVRLLVFGGSQGARFLNERVPELVGLLAQGGLELRVVHQTGLAERDATAARYEALGIDADVRPYIEDMAREYADADLAICRSGASTLAELTAVGLPAVLVPFPFAAHDHQAANAQAVAASGGAIMVRQGDWDAAKIANEIGELLARRESLGAMATSARALGRPEAADRIATDVLSICAGGER